MTESELPEVMSVDQCADYLKLNKKTVYDMIKLGQLPGAQFFGRVIRIRKEPMLEWMDTGKGPVKQPKRAK